MLTGTPTRLAAAFEAWSIIPGSVESLIVFAALLTTITLLNPDAPAAAL